MNKVERNKLKQMGFIILRSKFNAKGKWQICMQSDKGGWLVYNDLSYDDKQSCENALDILCKDSDVFRKDY